MRSENTVPVIQQSEVDTVIKSLKHPKSPGQDGIMNVILEGEAEELAAVLCKFFNKVIKKEEIRID